MRVSEALEQCQKRRLAATVVTVEYLMFKGREMRHS